MPSSQSNLVTYCPGHILETVIIKNRTISKILSLSILPGRSTTFVASLLVIHKPSLLQFFSSLETSKILILLTFSVYLFLPSLSKPISMTSHYNHSFARIPCSLVSLPFSLQRMLPSKPLLGQQLITC